MYQEKRLVTYSIGCCREQENGWDSSRSDVEGRKSAYLDLLFLFLLLNYHSWESRECEKVPGNHLLSLLVGLGDMDQPKFVGMICENEKNW